MNPIDYQRDADRTLCDQAKALGRMTVASTQVLHAAMGITKEGGELLSLVEKWLFYAKDFGPLGVTGVPAELSKKIVDELGDVMWYAAELCNAAGLDLGDVMKSNVAKLRSRYPNAGWEAHRAEDANRDRAAEARAVATSAGSVEFKQFRDSRRPEEILRLRASGVGCCERFSDNSSCTCLEVAVAAEAGRRQKSEAHLLSDGYREA